MHELQDSLGPDVDDAVGRPEPNSVFDAVKAGDYLGVLRQQAVVLARVLDAAGQNGRAAAAAMASKELRELYEVLEGMEAGGGDGDEHEQSEADRLARVTGLDMAEAGFRPTVTNYLGRVTKTRILEAVREGAGDRAADLIAHLKKGDMAKEAERLLADTGWLPEPLRPTVDAQAVDGATDQDQGSVALPDFLAGGHEDTAEAADDPEALVAAE